MSHVSIRRIAGLPMILRGSIASCPESSCRLKLNSWETPSWPVMASISNSSSSHSGSVRKYSRLLVEKSEAGMGWLRFAGLSSRVAGAAHIRPKRYRRPMPAAGDSAKGLVRSAFRPPRRRSGRPRPSRCGCCRCRRLRPCAPARAPRPRAARCRSGCCRCCAHRNRLRCSAR